ncbi:MAG: hypothetical protein P4L10_06820 [Acidobacteriaceae bacterium]|nr:hypothetical protein [Acidobacteriaceae bacterium]
MMSRRFTNFRAASIFSAVMALLVVASSTALADPPAAAVAAFNAYSSTVEARLAQQHRLPQAFLAPMADAPQNAMRLRRGELIVEQLTPANSATPGSLLHHWRGTAFAPGARAEDFEKLMKDFNAYSKYFSPQVLQSKVLAQQGNHFQTTMRVRQRHVITVVMDTAYDVTFSRLDAHHGYSISRSTYVAEIDSPGVKGERVLGSSEEYGFLWRINTYWSYEERDGGLYMQIESITLTRSIPTGLSWAVRPFVESVPRESIEFTLHSTCNALHKSPERN